MEAPSSSIYRRYVLLWPSTAKRYILDWRCISSYIETCLEPYAKQDGRKLGFASVPQGMQLLLEVRPSDVAKLCKDHPDLTVLHDEAMSPPSPKPLTPLERKRRRVAPRIDAIIQEAGFPQRCCGIAVAPRGRRFVTTVSGFSKDDDRVASVQMAIQDAQPTWHVVKNCDIIGKPVLTVRGKIEDVVESNADTS